MMNKVKQVIQVLQVIQGKRKTKTCSTCYTCNTSNTFGSPGVTIIELLVYMGLLSIFMVVLVDVFVTILNAKLNTESTSALDADSRYILSRLSYDVARADTMGTPASLGGSGGTLSVTTSGITYSYSLDGSGNINLNNGSTNMKLNGNDTSLTNLTFTKIGNADTVCAPQNCKPTVKVSFTIQSNIVLQGNRQESQTVETTLGLR